MAAARGNYSERQLNRKHSMYVYGNAAPAPSREPERKKKQSRQGNELIRRRKYKRLQQRRALRANKRYVTALAFAGVFVLLMCMNYIQLQSMITSRTRNISAMQEELADLKEENNTRYNTIVDSVDLDEIKERAINDLGMVYATEDQVIEYAGTNSDYIKQYEAIPESGVLAQSDKQ